MKEYREIYRELARAKRLTNVHIVQYAVLRAIDKPFLNKESELKLAIYYLKNAFTPLTCKKKLDNGRHPLDTLSRLIMLIYRYEYSILGDLPHKIFSNDLEYEAYKRVMAELHEKYFYFQCKAYDEYKNRYYVYIFVRQDISPEQQLVQAAHAAAKMGYRQKMNSFINKSFEGDVVAFDNLYFTIIGVKDLIELEAAHEECKNRAVITYSFVEPDMGYMLTAFATNPIKADLRGGLLSYKKLKFGELK